MGIRLFLNSIAGAALVAAPFSVLGDMSSADVASEARQARIIFLGEQHDNLAHHEVQAAWVADLEPRAVVFEMLAPEQAGKITAENRLDMDTLEMALGWNDSGWPEFSMYYPIFSAASDAQIIGAGVPRDRLRALMGEELDTVVGAETAARFKLDQPLPEAEQAAREGLQRAAHCDALPETMLPRMVNVQRLRDAALAQAALDALDQFGAPIVVITGNGHAREDWGAPALVRLADPNIQVFTLGQGEAGSVPQGGFAMIADGPSVDRGDPCDAFK